MTAIQVTRFLHSRVLMIIMAVAMVSVAVLTNGAIPAINNVVDHGVLFASTTQWISVDSISKWVNIGMIMVIALLMMALNRRYNLLRATTLLDTSLFLLMYMSMPWLLCRFNAGTLLCLSLLICLLLLYSTYQTPVKRERIFLIFFILSALTMTQYCYAVYIPVFIIGTMQMRIFSFKTLAAIIMGIISPWFVVLGCDIVPFEAKHGPEPIKALATFNLAENLDLVISVLVSAVVLIAGWCLNFPRMIAYNAHIRAYNGTMSVLALVTVIALCVDITNIAAYAPVLYFCAAFFMGRMFAASVTPRSYIPITSIILIYIALLVWTLMP